LPLAPIDDADDTEEQGDVVVADASLA